MIRRSPAKAAYYGSAGVQSQLLQIALGLQILEYWVPDSKSGTAGVRRLNINGFSQEVRFSAIFTNPQRPLREQITANEGIQKSVHICAHFDCIINAESFRNITFFNIALGRVPVAGGSTAMAMRI